MIQQNLIEIIKPAPVLNTKRFSFAFGGATGREIPLNKEGHPYCMEFVALPGMQFVLEKTIEGSHAAIYQVFCSFYPIKPLYIDSRFALIRENSALRDVGLRKSLSKQVVLQRMKEKLGVPYVWGGNWSHGIPEMLTYYPPQGGLDETTRRYWTVAGLDCSGLLFEAAEGQTPRNTKELLSFGRLVRANEPLLPLDMIIYPGHVIFVLDQNTTIESKFPFGVITKNIGERFETISQTHRRIDFPPEKKVSDFFFMVRRLWPETK